MKYWPEIKNPQKYAGKELFIGSVTDPYNPQEEVIQRAKEQCNLIWLENLNLLGGYKTVIMDYIQRKHPELLPLYQEIYTKNDRRYWELLDGELKAWAAEIGLDYVTNDDSMSRPFEAPPIIVNFFYHSEIKKSARKGGEHYAGIAGG